MRGILGRLVMALHILGQASAVAMATKMTEQNIEHAGIVDQWKDFTNALPDRLPDAASQESNATARIADEPRASTGSQSVDGSVTPTLSELSDSDSNDRQSLFSEPSTEVPNPYLALVPTPEELRKPLPDVSGEQPSWKTEITVETVDRAVQLVRYFVKVYFKLLGSSDEVEESTPDLAVYAGPSNAIPYDGDVVNRYGTCIKRLLQYGPFVTTSQACARKLIPSVSRNGKASYRKEDAKAFFTLVGSAGLGSIVEEQNGGRTVIKFKRSEFESIPGTMRDQLQLERY